jgi:hypothetical protein
MIEIQLPALWSFAGTGIAGGKYCRRCSDEKKEAKKG